MLPSTLGTFGELVLYVVQYTEYEMCAISRLLVRDLVIMGP